MIIGDDPKDVDGVVHTQNIIDGSSEKYQGYDDIDKSDRLGVEDEQALRLLRGQEEHVEAEVCLNYGETEEDEGCDPSVAVFPPVKVEYCVS